jgi:hypothetical protein
MTLREIATRALKTCVQAFAGTWIGLNVVIGQSTWSQIKAAALASLSAAVLSLMQNLATDQAARRIVANQAAAVGVGAMEPRS